MAYRECYRSKSVQDAIARLRAHDTTLLKIDLRGYQCSKAEINALVEMLLTHPNVITHIALSCSQLTDEATIKLAQYVAVSTTIEWLWIADGCLNEVPYLTMAAALHINTSLRLLYISNSRATYVHHLAMAFVEALMINPIRPVHTEWYLSENSGDYRQLKEKAVQLGHPNMQSLLATHLCRRELY